MCKEREILNKLEFVHILGIEYNGRVVIDFELAKVLKLLNKYKSLNKVCKMLGLTYSRILNKIREVERYLGIKIIECRKGGIGGGYTILTEFGQKILDLYFSKFEEFEQFIKECNAKLIVYSSHDPLFQEILSYISKKLNIYIQIHWVGSGKALSAILMNKSDISGIHLYDPDTNTYNVTYIKRFWLSDKVVLIKGYRRSIGFVYHNEDEVNSLDSIIKNRLKIVNRNIGSGTRVLLDYLIEFKCRKLKVDRNKLISLIPGYEVEVGTHNEVIEFIKTKRANTGLSIEYLATKEGLKFNKIRDEEFDFVIPKSKLNKIEVQEFVEFLKSSEFERMLNLHKPGYEIMSETSKILYV